MKQHITTNNLIFRDHFSYTRKIEDLANHIGASMVHMPGLRLARDGAVRHCQGTAIVDWHAAGPDGAVRGRGANVIELAGDGRIAAVTGFWSA